MKRNYNRYYKSLNPQLAKNPSDKFRSDTESDLDDSDNKIYTLYNK